MTIRQFINEYENNLEFKNDIKKNADMISKSYKKEDLEEHKKNISMLENSLLLCSIMNEIYSVRKEINIK